MCNYVESIHHFHNKMYTYGYELLLNIENTDTTSPEVYQIARMDLYID